MQMVILMFISGVIYQKEIMRDFIPPRCPVVLGKLTTENKITIFF